MSTGVLAETLLPLLFYLQRLENDYWDNHVTSLQDQFIYSYKMGFIIRWGGVWLGGEWLESDLGS